MDQRFPTPTNPNVVTAFVDSGDIGLRVIMIRTLAPGAPAPPEHPFGHYTVWHHFTVAMLYGAGVLRENFAVQVLT